LRKRGRSIARRATRVPHWPCWADKFDCPGSGRGGEGTDTRMPAFEGETLRLPSVDDRIPPLG
jgi:hypothetical protein